MQAYRPTRQSAENPPMGSVQPRVLVVDDSSLTRRWLSAELGKMGLLVDGAASVEEALSIVVDRRPDIAIVDVYLDRGPSGVDLAQTLRADPSTASTFIIALSGHYAPDCLQLALDAGCDRFLIKPCPSELLVETIQDFLSSRGRAAG
jgi:two-component system, cell cycle response regulator DivK